MNLDSPVVKQTHSAVVILLGDRALKLKKPLDLGFLDFRRLEERVRVCQHEVALNQRLAPDVYLGVGHLIDADGETAEPVVVMRRMPEDRRLADLVRSGADVGADLDEVARLLAGFHEKASHQKAEHDQEIDAEGTRDAVAARWSANLGELAEVGGEILDPAGIAEVSGLVERFLTGRAPLFEDRIRAGAIVDGHGDLLAEDIFCLSDGPRILDCLEFDDRLRYLDRLDEVAFLMMDLERLGADAAANRFLAAYLEHSGETAPPGLVDHYIGYRAVVRAKVACIRAQQGADGATAEARTLWALAETHLRTAEVRLVLVGGTPGTGKSTLAADLAARRSWALLGTDSLRKELAGVGAGTSLAEPYGSGRYAAERTDEVYRELLRRAERLLVRGSSVILDATWATEAHRDAARDLAARTSSVLTEIRCVREPAAADAWIRARVQAGGSASDADPEIAARLRASFEPWPTAHTVDAGAGSGVDCDLVRTDRFGHGVRH